jgi:hypothetical protein
MTAVVARPHRHRADAYLEVATPRLHRLRDTVWDVDAAIPHTARGRVCVPLRHPVHRYVGESSAQELRPRGAPGREGPRQMRVSEKRAAICAVDAVQTPHQIHLMHRNRQDGAVSSNQHAAAPPCLVESMVFLALAAGLRLRTFFPPLGPALHRQTGCSAKCIREIIPYANVQDSPCIWQLSGLAAAAANRERERHVPHA